jgi:dTMP kinase
MSRAGLFFSFDGIDGVGKSTQVGLFCRWLSELGHDVLTCRDPGSTRVGEALRDIVLGHTFGTIARMSEMLVYMAARAQLVQEVIRPALDAGRTVVADRFLLANVAYQGHAGGLDVEQVWQVGQIATSGLLPTGTFVLDMDPDLAAGRIDRATDRMEQHGSAYFRRVRQGFLDEAARCRERIVVIDAQPPRQQVQAAIRQAARKWLDLP